MAVGVGSACNNKIGEHVVVNKICSSLSVGSTLPAAALTVRMERVDLSVLSFCYCYLLSLKCLVMHVETERYVPPKDRGKGYYAQTISHEKVRRSHENIQSVTSVTLANCVIEFSRKYLNKTRSWIFVSLQSAVSCTLYIA